MPRLPRSTTQVKRNPLVAARCAEYLGYFVADDNVGNMQRGTQWLVWRFESDSTLGGGPRPGTVFSLVRGHVLLFEGERGLCSNERACVHTHMRARPLFPPDGLDGRAHERTPPLTQTHVHTHIASP